MDDLYALSPAKPPMSERHCSSCETEQGELRILYREYWSGRKVWTCEECFTPGDAGPCFDDLPI